MSASPNSHPFAAIKALPLGVVVMLAAPQALAVSFGDKEGVHGNLDTTISYGIGVRTQDRDPTLIGARNGGLNSSVNGDDGNLNYDESEPYSTLLKATHELDVAYKNLGFFARGYYFYDFSNAQRDALGDRAEERVGKGIKLLDYYAKGTFDLGGHNLQVRGGNQVVSWGESTFINNGINVINAVDVARLRTPGSEVKEALLPTPMAWASLGLTEHVAVEAFATTAFRFVKIDPRGSYFSSNDSISDDSDRIYLLDDQHRNPARWVMRGSDRRAQNGGEYGVAMRIHAPELNNTEFGLYYANYHHRAPIISATRGGINVAGVPVPINAPTSAPTTGYASYFVEYPEDVDLFGISFNTAGPGGVALQGEYSYRPNLPLQIASGEVSNAALGLANSITGGAAAANAVAVGTEISGYKRVRMHQAQITATKAFPAVLKADQLLLLGEVGYTYLDLPDGIHFGGYGETAPTGSFGAPAAAFAGKGFATRSSWGYSLSAQADYNNAIGAIRLTPRLAISHAVNGVSPTFNEGVRSYTIGLGASYRDQWKADLAYTSFFGGRLLHPTATTYINTNSIADRDFVSMSLSYSF